jgi:integrator complex subunit 7
MIEVVDGILLCPVPFPLDLLTVSSLPRSQLQLLADPEQTGIDASDALPDSQRPELDTIECYPGISFDFYATGEIPASFQAKSRLPFTTVLVWHRAEYIGPIQEDEHIADEKQEDEAMADEKHDEDTIEAPTKVIPGPWDYTEVSTSMQTSGKFSIKVECPPIREEGNYVIEVKLGCRDVRGGEWEVALEEEPRRMKVQATRSLWHS